MYDKGIEAVKQFHDKLGMPVPVVPTLPDDDLAAFRTGFLREEVAELEEALAGGDMVKAFDALLDIAYVTYGTALWCGITPRQWSEGFAAVQRANMEKMPGVTKRRYGFDAVKPAGWRGPEEDLSKILGL